MYAQINYQQKLGYAVTAAGNSELVTIAAAGCFVTAFCNLLQSFGENVDPPALNQYFIDHHDYIAEVDRGQTLYDLCAWGSISSYDGTITTVQIGGAGWPQSNDAIVKFVYGNGITHFCKVADWAQETIVDSWDGKVKKSPYGNPVAWATYQRHAPQPAPSVATPPPVAAAKYTVVETYLGGKQVKLNKQPTYLWGMNYDFNYMKDHPVETHNIGEVWTVTNKVQHQDGYFYYRRDGQVDGFNILDCDDYMAPVASTTPAAPLPIPTDTTPYQVFQDIPGYSTSNDAANNMNKKLTVTSGKDYYIFNRRTDASGNLIALNVTKTPGKSYAWINPADNVQKVYAPTPAPEPAPAPAPEPEAPATPPWAGTYKQMREDGKPTTYVANRTLTIKDYSGTQPDRTLKQYQEIGIYGTFTVNGVEYYRPKLNADTNFSWYYGIPKFNANDGSANLLLESTVYDSTTTSAERKYIGTENFLDRLDLAEAWLKKQFGNVKFFDIIPLGKKKQK